MSSGRRGVFFRRFSGDFLNETDDLPGKNDGQQGKADAPHGDIAQRQKQHDQVGQKINPFDAPAGHMRYAHGKRVVSARRAAASDAKSRADADKTGTDQRGKKRVRRKLRPERGKALIEPVAQREAGGGKKGIGEKTPSEELPAENVAQNVQNGAGNGRGEGKPVLQQKRQTENAALRDAADRMYVVKAEGEKGACEDADKTVLPGKTQPAVQLTQNKTSFPIRWIFHIIMTEKSRPCQAVILRGAEGGCQAKPGVLKWTKRAQKGGGEMEQGSYEKRGYLNEDFRLFHLTSAMREPVDWHYHTFDKLCVYLGGEAIRYGVEGRSYCLEPGDLILVPHGCVHRPEVQPGAAYDRMLLYISPDFLRRASTDDTPLETCFVQAAEGFCFVIRTGMRNGTLLEPLLALERAAGREGFGQTMLEQALIVQLLIELTRGMQEQALPFVSASAVDEKIAAILRYLACHLTERISIDELAAKFYISKYHMMRRFHAQTGYTIHAYLVGKRLMLAREKISAGMPVMEAAGASGFGDYSAFSRAYRKQFGHSPRAMQQTDKDFSGKSRKDT